MLPEPLRELLRGAFGGAEPADLQPTSGGYSHLSCAATIGGRLCVIKAADQPLRRADLRREAAALALLPGRGLLAPAVLALAESPAWTALVTARLGGEPGQALYSGPVATLAPAYRELGQALARLHTIVPADRAEPDDLDLAPRAEQAAADLAGLPLPPELRADLAAALDHPIWRPSEPRLTHGDAGLHNVLRGEAGLALLDWEWAGWAHPLRDLAWVAWTMRFRRLPVSLWEDLLAGYAALAPLPAGDAATLRALALGQIADILRRAYAGPAWDEWLRRLGWSVGLDFGSEAVALQAASGGALLR